ncbi:hypothetical protein LR48_Vigan635s008000 [Vigna angularis]|uniref:Uncharacterized protein n=2 Tax=Phaseolus angularis TaxID=3914 RepID=A0A0L9TEV7_PHAAN|nr:uncharacterized protein HKW66_Vig0091390 [Vigna angularis]KOM29155.1 hypothetical protein LR48_Vigan635s008000 [Vigna angularis]BAT80338.1 hypothetical protein VIGAN_02334100 [Vigna angularis var. angularis]
MGNCHGSCDYSERFPLGDSSVAVLRRTKNRKGHEVEDTWKADYYSFGKRSCEYELTKTNRSKREEEISIDICDHVSNNGKDDVDFHMDMRVEEGLVLANLTLNGPRYLQQLPERKTPMAQGGVFKSSSFLYGRDNDRKGLIVVLRAKRRDNDKELPYMMTVKHYFVSAWCSHGVSLQAKIRSDRSDGGLSFEIEKPYMQSKRDLLSMIDDVKGKGWCPNPTTSDFPMELSNKSNGNNVPAISFGGKNNSSDAVPAFYTISGKQNITSLISSSGWTEGNYNSSLIFQDCEFYEEAVGTLTRCP